MDFYFDFDLLKARKKLKRKTKKKSRKGKFYTPSFVIAVVYPPLARYASIWPECAKAVFKKKGRKSGYKADMMPWFNAIHKCVLAHKDYKKLKRKKRNDILRISTIKSAVPVGIVPISWSDAIDAVFTSEKWTTRKEYEEKLAGLMSHAFHHKKLYKVKK